MKKHGLTSLIMGGLIAVSSIAFAGDSATDANTAAENAPSQAAIAAAQDKAAAVPALSGLVKKGASVQRRITVGDDIVGWMIDFAGEKDMYYTSADGNFLLLGALIDSGGNNVSAQIKEALASDEAADGTVAGSGKPAGNGWRESMFEKIKSINTIDLKGEGRDLYVFFEPVCPHCARLHQELAYVDVKTHYIPVSFLSPDSSAIAGTLMTLQGDQLDEALDRLVMGTLSGGSHRRWLDKYQPDELPSDLNKQLADNSSMMQALGISGTPAIIYEDSAGDVQVIKGAPQPTALRDIAQN